MFIQTFQQMKKQLGQLDKWLETATTYAAEKKFNPNNLVGARLIVDQFTFARQVQSACDTAKLGASRLTGKDAPKHDDSETTIEQLRQRVRSTIDYIAGFSAQDFEASATRSITQPRWEGKTMAGSDYFMEHVIPNFFFHCTTAYAILRANGVPVGKRDYLGALTMRPAA